MERNKRSYGGQFVSKKDYKKGIRKVKIQMYALMIAITLGTLTIVGMGKYTEYAMAKNLPVEVKVQQVHKMPVREYAFTQAVKNGLDPAEFIAVVWCESKFQEDAHNINTDHSLDLGLVEINHKWHPEVKLKDALDPYKSIDWMIKIRLQDKNYHQWSCAKKVGSK